MTMNIQNESLVVREEFHCVEFWGSGKKKNDEIGFKKRPEKLQIYCMIFTKHCLEVILN